MARIKTAASIRANPIQAILPLVAIKVAVSATHAESAAMAANITCIRVVSDTDCHLRITQAGTAATTSDMFLPKNQRELITCVPGDVVSVIRDTADGSLYISPAAAG